MTRTSGALRAGALGALLFTTALTAPAMAQTARPHRAVDGNGVDLTHGDFLMTAVEGTIGSGPAELQLIRTGVWVGGGIDLNGHQWDRIGLQIDPVGGGFRYVVTVGTRFEVFTSLGTLPSGSSLTGSANNYIYRTADGTTIAFGDGGHGGWGTDSNFCTGWAGQGSCTLIPTAISEPNGKAVSIGWEMWTYCWGMIESETLPCNFTPRIAGVGNSFGYSIHFAYASGGEGGGGSSPPSSWRQRTGATFRNGTVSGDPVQASVSYSYPSTGVTQVTDMGGLVWRFTGTILGATGIRRPGASSDTTTISYSGAVVTSVVNEGVTTTYSRSVSGSTATMTVTQVDGDSGTTDPVTTAVSNLTTGRLTSITDPLSQQTQFQYDGNARLTRVTQPEGNYLQYTYDARGNVTEARQVAKSGSGLSDIVMSASFDSTCANPVTCNSPNSTTDARGNVTNYTYDSTHGGLLTATAPAPASGADRPQMRYTYTQTNGEYLTTEAAACASGTTPTCVDTANETVSTNSYDANGNLVTTTTANGTGTLTASTAMTYDALGNLLTVDGPLSGSDDTVRYRYNASRQLIGAVGPDPDGTGELAHRATRTTYTNGRPTATETGTVSSQSDTDWAGFSASQRIEQDYDANARPTVQRLMSGSTTYQLTQTSYDALGRTQCVAQRMNPSEFASLPSDACTLDSQGSYGPDRITRLGYDAAGRVNLAQTGYGVSGVEANDVAVTYTANGLAETVTDAESNRTTYAYDGFDRLSRMRMPHPSTDNTSSTTDYEDYAYDAAGNVTLRQLRDGTSVAYSYDNLNRLTARNLPSSPWYNIDRSYTYDLMNRMTSASGNGTITLSYDALGRLVSESGGLGTTGYQHDAAGRRTLLTYPDGTLSIGYTYDVAGNVTEIRENPAGGNALLASYAYDDRGRRTGLTRGNGATTSWSYDAVSRLTQLVQNPSGTGHDITLGLSYNPAGQIAAVTRSNHAYAWTGHYAVTRSYTANGLNQYTAAGSVTPTHDGNGNLTSAGSTSYGYNAENRLVTASGATYQELIDDSADRLHRYYDGAANRWLAYDGQSLIAEYGSGGTIQRRFVHGSGTDEPLLWYEGSGTSERRWLHADERGSVIAVSDGTGAVTNVNAYDEYGIPASGNSGRFQYSGQQWLPELGMQYSRARIYSPTLGRFLQTDPIGHRGGMNLYGYVLNDPVNRTDPSGLCGIIDVGYGWYSKEGEYLGPAPGHYYILSGCDGGFEWGGGGMGGPALNDGGGGGVGGGTTEEDRCPRDAPDNRFREQGRGTVGPIGYGARVDLWAGTTDVRVRGFPGQAMAAGRQNILQLILQMQSSVSLFFTESSAVPMQTIVQHDLVMLGRGGRPSQEHYDVPAGTRSIWIVGTQTTVPNTVVVIYGCQQQ